MSETENKAMEQVHKEQVEVATTTETTTENKVEKERERWAANVDAEFKQELQKFMALEKTKGVTAQDFLKKAYQLYKNQEVMDGNNILSQEIKEVHQIANRLTTMLVNASERVKSHVKDIRTAAEVVTDDKEKMIIKLQEDLNVFDEKHKKTIELLKKEITEKDERLTKAKETQKELAEVTLEISELKAQNSTQLKTISSLQADVAEKKALEKQLKEIEEKHKNELLELQKKLDEATQSINDKDTEIKEIKKDNARDVEALRKEHERERESLKDKAAMELEKEKSALESKLQREHLEEVNKLQQSLAEAETIKKQAVLDVQTEMGAKVLKLEEKIAHLSTHKEKPAKQDK